MVETFLCFIVAQARLEADNFKKLTLSCFFYIYFVMSTKTSLEVKIDLSRETPFRVRHPNASLTLCIIFHCV